MPQYWASFNLAPKRIQNGGWARQITEDDFKISTTIAGVNMRLGPNGVRELHWHQQAEWAIMTFGICRVTILDQNGRPQVADVKEGDLWYFPAGLPHSLQGLGPDGCEFVIAFDSGNASEFNTLLVTDWIAHTPPEVLAKNFGVPVEAFKNIPLHNRWIYQSDLQAPPLDAVEAQMAAVAGKPPNPFVFRLGDMAPNWETKSGTVRIADSTNFLVSKTVAASMVTIKPGGMRECIGIPMPMNGCTFSRVPGVRPFSTLDQRPSPQTFMRVISATSRRRLAIIWRTPATATCCTWKFPRGPFRSGVALGWLAHSPIDIVAESL